MLKLPKAKSILYVEDEKLIREELAEVLENFCERLYLADDGYQGLLAYTEHKPDIVVSDIRMPVMDGIDMARRIKETHPEARIVFTTAFSDVGFFQEAIELQVDGYILKPISLDALEKKLRNIIQNIELKAELLEKDQMLFQTSKLAAMGEMIGNIAHQWKQPLSTISMSLNNVKADGALGELNQESIAKCASVVENQVKHLTATMDDFRAFFKPNAMNETYNLKEFVDKCINLVKASFDESTIETIKEIDEKINSYGDSNQLTHALINILNNAKDALKTAEKLRKRLVFIVTMKENSEHIVIIVKDNAGGIPEEIVGKVFEPYFTTKEQSGGTGLGLYIAHTIVTKNLNGTIVAENEIFEHDGIEYKGAKFTIVLPLDTSKNEKRDL